MHWEAMLILFAHGRAATMVVVVERVVNGHGGLGEMGARLDRHAFTFAIVKQRQALVLPDHWRFLIYDLYDLL